MDVKTLLTRFTVVTFRGRMVCGSGGCLPAAASRSEARGPDPQAITGAYNHSGLRHAISSRLPSTTVTGRSGAAVDVTARQVYERKSNRLTTVLGMCKNRFHRLVFRTRAHHRRTADTFTEILQQPITHGLACKETRSSTDVG
ncbi:hypothetical protein J6590_019092 [Homalodisca vitripennis]|nr:hypothetical protein J6590_019092 [Homalodisca vitripennis]